MASAEYSPDFGGGGGGILTLGHCCRLTNRGERLQPGEVKQSGTHLPFSGTWVPGALHTGEAGIAIPITPLSVKLEG